MRFNSNVLWDLKLEQLEEYILKNNKLPTQTGENKILGTWVSHNNNNFKK